MMSAVMLCVIMLSAVMLIVVMLSVVMLIVIMLIVIILSALSPGHSGQFQKTCARVNALPFLSQL